MIIEIDMQTNVQEKDQSYGASISRIVTASMASFRFLLAWVADMIYVSETNQF